MVGLLVSVVAALPAVWLALLVAIAGQQVFEACLAGGWALSAKGALVLPFLVAGMAATRRNESGLMATRISIACVAAASCYARPVLVEVVPGWSQAANALGVVSMIALVVFAGLAVRDSLRIVELGPWTEPRAYAAISGLSVIVVPLSYYHLALAAAMSYLPQAALAAGIIRWGLR